MVRLNFLIIATLSFVLLACSAADSIVLVQNGQSDYSIVLPENAHPLEQKAATELSNYLAKISGATLPIVAEPAAVEKGVYLGQTNQAGRIPPEPATVRYFTDGPNLIILGGAPQSTLFAVYEFLEKELACRFLSPTVEKIPVNQSIELPALQYEYTPEITTRTVHSRLFYDNPAFADQLKVTTEAFPGYFPGARVHTFHRFVPKEKYYDQHPEYYALRGERRIPTQLCLTNASVLKIVKDTIAAILAEHPETKVISVSQDDNTQYCQCAQCEAIHQREEAPSGSMIAFVNEVAKAFPDIQVSTLAYQYTRKAPKNLVPASNVLITLCTIECDRSGPIADKCTDFTEDLIAWGEKNSTIRIWDYTTQFTNFLAPFPNLHTLQPNIQLFKNNRANWIFEQHSHHPSELFELRSYLLARLLWNPSANVDKVINSFVNGYYEEAGPFVEAYVFRVHEELRKDSSFFLFLYGDPSQGFDSFLSEAMLSVYDSLFEAGARAVSGKPEVLTRVQVARLGVDYAILEHHKLNLRAELEKSEEAIRSRLNRFEASCKAADITLMNEMRYTVVEYLDLYEKTLERAAKSNLADQKPVQLLTQPKKYANEDPKVLTDGAFGGSSFYANWLGFEGNDLEAIIDLGAPTSIAEVSAGFLQVTNHVVFFPEEVQFLGSLDGQNYRSIGKVENQFPLTDQSKVNDIQYFEVHGSPQDFRFIKIIAKNKGVAPVWHHAAGLPSWIFVDEVAVR